MEQQNRYVDYSLIKAIHLSAVAISLGGFILRGAGVLAGAHWARSRAARTLPHINDTVLLVSAVCLAVLLQNRIRGARPT